MTNKSCSYFDGETIHIDEPEPKPQVERASQDYDIVGAFRLDLQSVDSSFLSPEETAALVLQVRDPNTSPVDSAAARERLILSLTSLPFHFCKKFGKRLPHEEIISICNLAILSSIDSAIAGYRLKDSLEGSTDPSLALASGGGFVNYMAGVCKRNLAKAVTEQESVVKLPKDGYMFKARKAKGQTIPARTEARLNALHGSDRSLGEEVFEKNGTEPLLLIDTVPNPAAIDHEHEIGLEEGREHLRTLFRAILNAREVLIVEHLYGLAENGDTHGATAPEVDRQLGLKKGTAKYVAQQARRKLKAIPELKEFLQLHATPARFVGKQQLPTLPLNIFPLSVKLRSSQHMRKLTEAQVREIRKLRAEGVPNKELAKRFKMSQAAISTLTNRKTWRHVK